MGQEWNFKPVTEGEVLAGRSVSHISQPMFMPSNWFPALGRFDSQTMSLLLGWAWLQGSAPVWRPAGNVGGHVHALGIQNVGTTPNWPMCPVFCWDKAHFLLVSWSRAVFWIQYENNVCCTLMRMLEFSCLCFPNSKPFQFSMVWQRAGAQEARRELTWTDQRDVPYLFHTCQYLYVLYILLYTGEIG